MGSENMEEDKREERMQIKFENGKTRVIVWNGKHQKELEQTDYKIKGSILTLNKSIGDYFIHAQPRTK